MSKPSEKSTSAAHSTDRYGNLDFKAFGFSSPGNRGKGSSRKHKLYDDSNNSFCSPSVKKLRVTNLKSNFNDVNSETDKNAVKQAIKVDFFKCSSDIIRNNDNSNPADDTCGDNSFRNWDIKDVSSGCDANSPIKRGSGSKIDKVLLEKFASPISVPSAFSSPARIKTLPLINSQTPVATKTFTKQQIVSAPTLNFTEKVSNENENAFVDNQTQGICRGNDLINIDSQCSRGNKLTKISKDKQSHSKKKELLNLSSYFNDGSDSDDSQNTLCHKSPLKSQHFMISDESPKKSSHHVPGTFNISISSSRNASQNCNNLCSLSIDFGTQESVEVDYDPLRCIQIQEDLTPVKNSDTFKHELTDDENCGDNCLSVKKINVVKRNSPVKDLSVKINNETTETYGVSALTYKGVEILKKNSPVVRYFNKRLNENNNDLTPVKESIVNINDEASKKEPTGICQPYKAIEIIKMNSPVVKHLYDQFTEDINYLSPVKETHVNINDETPKKEPTGICQPYKAIDIIKMNSPVVKHLYDQFNEDSNDLSPVKETHVNINDETPKKEPTGICQPYKAIEIIKMNSPVVKHLYDQFNEDSNDLSPVKETHVNINDESPEKDLDETQILYKPIDILKKKSPVVRCIIEKDQSKHNLTCIRKSSHIQMNHATPKNLCQVYPSLECIDINPSQKNQQVLSDDFTPTMESNVVISDESPVKGKKQNSVSYSISKLIKRNSLLNHNPVPNVDDSNSPLSPRNIDFQKDQASNILKNDTNWISGIINEFEIKNKLSENSFNNRSPMKQLDPEISEEVTPVKYQDISCLHKAKLESVVKLSKKEINYLNSNKMVNVDVTNENTLEDIEKYKVPFQINHDALAHIQNDETPQNSQEIFISDNTPVKNHRFNISDESTPTKLNMDIINEHVSPLNLGRKDKFSLTVSKVKKKQSLIINCDQEIDDNVKLNSNHAKFGDHLNDSLEYDIDAFPSPSKDASVMPCERESAVIADIPGLTPRKNQIPVENTDQGIIYFSRKKKRLLKSTTLLSKAVAAVNNLKSRRKLFSYEIQVGLRSVEERTTSDPLKIRKTWKDHSSYYVRCQLPSQNHLCSLQFPTHSIIFVLNQLPKDVCENDFIKMYYPVQIFECPKSTNTLIAIAYYLEFIKNELSINELTNQNKSKSLIVSMDNYWLTDIFQKSLKTDYQYTLLNSARSECISDAIVNSSLIRSISLKVKILHSVLFDSNIYFAAVDSSKEFSLFEFISDSNIVDINKDTVNVQPVDCIFKNMKFNRKELVLENDWIRNLFELCHYKGFEKDSLVYILVPHDGWSPSQDFKRL